jgi:acetyl esterase
VPLDPTARQIVDAMAAMFPPIDFARSGTEHRRMLREAAAAVIHEGREPIGAVRDAVVAGPAGPVPVRIYRPVDAGASPLPVAVFTHGGGWVVCDLDSHDGVCRAIANASGAVVVAVDYRLAPEHRFPAGLEDAYAVLRWAAANAGELGGDPQRLAVVGDSAGGNLAAALALLARDRGGPAIGAQVLVYPVTDHDFTTASHRDPGDPKVLQSEEVQYFWQEYLADPADAADPRASPLRAPSLAGLPPALVITAAFDPLRDEGETYAARLADAGVPVELVRYDSMMHSFVTFLDALPDARDAVGRIGAHLRSALA